MVDGSTPLPDLRRNNNRGCRKTINRAWVPELILPMAIVSMIVISWTCSDLISPAGAIGRSFQIDKRGGVATRSSIPTMRSSFRFRNSRRLPVLKREALDPSDTITPFLPQLDHLLNYQTPAEIINTLLSSSITPLTTAHEDVGLLHIVSDAADSSADAAAAAAAAATTASPGWLKPWTDFLEKVLALSQRQLDLAGVPYSYGWSIVVLTLFVKTLTFPLTKLQVESQLKMQRLKPSLDKIKERYKRNPDIVEREKQVLYEEYDVNPTASLFPTLATIPIFLGLFYSLRNVAGEGLLDDQGFFWIPTLAGPVSFADRQAGVGLKWLYPLIDGEPPIGWDKAIRYLVLPASLVVAQILSSQILASISEKAKKEMEFGDGDDDDGIVTSGENDGEEGEEDKKKKDEEETPIAVKALTYVLPLVIGYFSLAVPSGLALYYLSNTLISNLQQVYLRELGGAELDELDLGEIPPGYAIRSGENVAPDDGDLSQEDYDALGPEWLPAALAGNESSWPYWETLVKDSYEQATANQAYYWSDKIHLSEFSEELEAAGNPEENLNDPYPELRELVSNGKEASEFDDLFNDPDFR
mmetsp:Transcript_33134/g.53788  ORF Transcript_33134/g.53788 Transcript_33134/m.53788 type:complete len:585 (+) Transcript_33134:160-1914(+)